jgi:hypothetical protein
VRRKLTGTSTVDLSLPCGRSLSLPVQYSSTHVPYASLVSLLPYDETAVLRQTKAEPGAIATGLKFEDTQLVTVKKFLLLDKFV